jgi:hypothetical protein
LGIWDTSLIAEIAGRPAHFAALRVDYDLTRVHPGKDIPMFRLLLALILSAACVPANAILLRIDYDLTTVLNASNWLLADPPPGQVHAAFTVDTGSALSSNFNFLTDDQNGDTCLGHVLFDNMTFSDIAVTSSNMSFGSIPTSNSGRLFGDNAGGNCPGGFFGGLRFATGDLEFRGSIDYLGMTQADFESSSDPLAVLFANAASAQINAQIIGNWGTLIAFSSAGTIHEIPVTTPVPAPSPLALFAAGILGFAVASRVRFSARVRRP